MILELSSLSSDMSKITTRAPLGWDLLAMMLDILSLQGDKCRVARGNRTPGLPQNGA